jgi:hypothetical protein
MFVPKIDDSVPRRQTALAEIDRVVSERLGRARVAGNAQPAAFNRQVAMYLAKRVGGWSLTKIGKFYNGRHHTTVRHAIRRIEALRELNPDVDGLLAVLIEQIEAVGLHAPSRRERVVRRIAITEPALPVTEEFLMILAGRLASHLKARIDEMLTTRLLDAGLGERERGAFLSGCSEI